MDNSTIERGDSPQDRAGDVEAALQRFIAQETLDGRDIGLDAATPLLEWGVINSLEIVRLIGFIKERFGVSVPASSVSAETFKDIASIAGLVRRLSA
jgi:acyl carrier protein